MVRGIAVLAAALVIGLTGCSSEPAETTAEVASENPYGGFPVDPPAADEVVLTITGATPRDYTMGELETRAAEEFTIIEPFVQKSETFRGIPLAELFAENGLTDDQQVATIALNDYQYVDSVQAFTSSDGILAVSQDGGPIAMDQGGPIRIVFPEGSEYFTFLDAWNWSLRSIGPAAAE